MIAACPKCRTRYKVDDAKIGASGIRLKCTRCETVFRVEMPALEAEPLEEESPAPAPAVKDPARLVLLADPDADSCQVAADALRAWGLYPITANDGVEAILTIQRELPRVVVLDAALPKMYGFQICELMKRNESLRHIPVVLIGAIHDENRYRRSPNELYGADRYLERPDLPQGLKPLLKDFGLSILERAASTPPAAPPVAKPAVAPAPAKPKPEAPRSAAPPAAPVAPPPRAAAPAAPSVAVAAPAATPKNDGLDAIRSKAERLARVVVSDVVLYNQDKFNRAVQSGTVLKQMEPDLVEGRAHFNAQIDARVRAEKDYLAEELLRVARMRGMR